MDFEEQLEKAEKLDSPSLVGSSVRSADDSPHNNYIHPEKYTGTRTSVSPVRKSVLSKDITASLDDLMREGALIASEEDFEQYLDKEGAVKDDVKYDETADTEETGSEIADNTDKPETTELGESEANTTAVDDEDSAKKPAETDPAVLESQAEKSETVKNQSDSTGQNFEPVLGESQLHSQQDYSTPNLSEYQLNNQIKDHDSLLAKIKKEDPHSQKEPSTTEKPALVQNNSFNPLPLMDGHGPEGFHSPYFFKDTKAEAIDLTRSRSQSRTRNLKPHLARGDSYKYTRDEDPAKYELPPDFEEDSERRSRQSRPTMGESIAAIEEEKINNEKFQSQILSRDHSLVTAGDYTNFNVDSSREPSTPYQYKSSALSSTYLRSISRSRSRQPKASEHNEKNDANPLELYKEGALINEDPYLTIDGFDGMVSSVVAGKKGSETKTDDSKEIKEEDEPKEEDETRKTELGSESKELDESEVESKSEVVPESKEDESEPKEDESESKEVESEPKEDESESKEVESEPKEDESESKEVESESKEIESESKEIESESKDDEIESKEVEAESKDEAEIKGDSESKEVALEDESKEDLEPEAKDDSISKDDSEVKEESELKEPELTEVSESKEVESETNDESESKEVESEAKEESETKEESESKETEAEESESKETESTELTEEPESKDVSESKELDVEPKLESQTESKADISDEEFDVSPEELRKHLESQPVYIFTSLIGGMQIIHKTNRLQTILRANDIKFSARDLGTDDEAKKIWRRYSNGKSLPGIVRGDDFIGNWEDIEEANEEYRVRELIYETL